MLVEKVDEIKDGEPVDVRRLRKIPYSEWLADRKKKGLPVPNFANFKFKKEDDKKNSSLRSLEE
ncbi:MAG TPA: hypothetical protein VN368_00665 [Candidatus Methylomirabilis sp.]|nr:hypothetical protein [Candidatus Methylomirabilis sp.]